MDAWLWPAGAVAVVFLVVGSVIAVTLSSLLPLILSVVVVGVIMLLALTAMAGEGSK